MTWIDEHYAAEQLAAAVARLRPDNSAVQHGGGDPAFTWWLHLVDNACMRRLEVGIFDLSDWDMHSSYDNGDSPADAVQEAIDNDDLYSGSGL
jgi:hypothetical protein